MCANLSVNKVLQIIYDVFLQLVTRDFARVHEAAKFPHVTELRCERRGGLRRWKAQHIQSNSVGEVLHLEFRCSIWLFQE